MAQAPQVQLALQDVQNRVRSILDQRKAQLVNLMQSDARAERLVISGLIAVAEMKDKEGNPIAHQCDPVSIARSIVQSALLGIDLTAGLGEGWLIKYGNQCTLQPGYRSWQRAAQAQGFDVVFDTVREGDEFDISRIPPAISHKYGIRSKDGRGKVIGAYAAAYKDGKLLATEWCDLEDLEAAHVASKSPNSPAWKNWEDRMQRKLPLVRLVKDLPIDWTGRNAKLREVDAIAERGGGYDVDFDIVDGVVSGAITSGSVPQPEDAVQSSTAKLLAKRNAKEPSAPTGTEFFAEEPPHDPVTGEVKESPRSEALVNVLAGIANADNSQRLMSVLPQIKKLANGEKEIASNEYRGKQHELDAKREPGSD